MTNKQYVFLILCSSSVFAAYCHGTKWRDAVHLYLKTLSLHRHADRFNSVGKNLKSASVLHFSKRQGAVITTIHTLLFGKLASEQREYLRTAGLGAAGRRMETRSEKTGAAPSPGRAGNSLLNCVNEHTHRQETILQQGFCLVNRINEKQQGWVSIYKVHELIHIKHFFSTSWTCSATLELWIVTD